jgi:hypothetical protein
MSIAMISNTGARRRSRVPAMSVSRLRFRKKYRERASTGVEDVWVVCTYWLFVDSMVHFPVFFLHRNARLSEKL